jgi:hypothetical protein
MKWWKRELDEGKAWRIKNIKPKKNSRKKKKKEWRINRL